MAASANGRRVSIITAGGGSCTEPVGAMFETTCTLESNTPGTIVTDEAVAITKVEHTYEVEFQGIKTPPAAGSISDCSVTIQSYANSLGGGGSPGTGGLTVDLQNCLFTNSTIDAKSDPVKQTLKGRYIGTSLSPTTVA